MAAWAAPYMLNLSQIRANKLVRSNLDIFLEDLDHLVDDVYTSIESAFLTADFVSKAEQELVIPNMGRSDSQVERHDDPPDTP